MKQYGNRRRAAAVGMLLYRWAGSDSTRQPSTLPHQGIAQCVRDDDIGIVPGLVPEELHGHIEIAKERVQHPGHLNSHEGIKDEPTRAAASDAPASAPSAERKHGVRGIALPGSTGQTSVR